MGVGGVGNQVVGVRVDSRGGRLVCAFPLGLSGEVTRHGECRRRGVEKVDRSGGEGAKGIVKVSGVMIYIIDGKRDQGPATGPPRMIMAIKLEERDSILQGSLRCHLNVIFVSKQPRAFVLPN